MHQLAKCFAKRLQTLFAFRLVLKADAVTIDIERKARILFFTDLNDALSIFYGKTDPKFPHDVRR
jgi:hypothetical protein